MSRPPHQSLEDAGVLPAQDHDAVKGNPEFQPITHAERVVIVAVETAEFRERVMARLWEYGYLPIEVDPQRLFDMEPVFDANRLVFFFLDAGRDWRFMHHLLEQIYQHWSDVCGGVVYAFWPSTPDSAGPFRLWLLEGTTWSASAYIFETAGFTITQRNDRTIDRLVRMLDDLG